MRRTILALSLLAALASSCDRPRGEATPVLAVGSTPGKALATIWLSPTPLPSPQPTSEPTLTPVPTLPLPTLPAAQPTLPIGTAGPLQQPASEPQANATPSPLVNCAPPPPPFAGAWQASPAVQGRLGCPVGLPQERTAAFQSFEHGFMFWIQAESSIYVLSNTAIQQAQETDNWWRLEDTWSEGEPAIDGSLVAPDGLLQPERGFGKVWRKNGFVREAVGWAVEKEQGYVAQWLNFENGWMITTPGGEHIFALAPSDEPPYSAGVHFGPQ